jgi:hypothetical protein
MPRQTPGILLLLRQTRNANANPNPNRTPKPETRNPKPEWLLLLLLRYTFCHDCYWWIPCGMQHATSTMGYRYRGYRDRYQLYGISVPGISVPVGVQDSEEPEHVHRHVFTCTDGGMRVRKRVYINSTEHIEIKCNGTGVLRRGAWSPPFPPLWCTPWSLKPTTQRLN